MMMQAKAKIFDSSIKRYSVLDSTNNKAKQLAEAGAVEGTVVVADQQRFGRGRLGRVWQSPAGKGLWFSLILRPRVLPEFGAQVTLLMAVAIVDALERATGLSAKIKWPNDILVNQKKICGILSELTLTEDGINYAIIGVGINVNLEREDFKDGLADIASSVFLETGNKWNCNKVLQAILHSFERRYEEWQQNGFSHIRSEWKNKNCTLNSKVAVKDDARVIFHGIAMDIDESGCLEVRNEEGILKKFDFGEISIRFSE